MALRPQDRGRGLSALSEARETRRRAIVLGKVRVREVATRFWLMTFAGLLVFSVVYFRYAEVELEARKSELSARQRAVREAMGSDGFELRERLEGWVMEFARADDVADQLGERVALERIAREPGIYLRLMRTDAASAESIRKAARMSLHDGFTACLFVGRKGDPAEGEACTATSRCGPGELCNEHGVCAAPVQPYNFRLLGEGLRVLEPRWRENLDAATNDLQVRAMELDLEDVGKHEVPAAAEMVRRSRYFTAVLDEVPEGGIPASPTDDGDRLAERIEQRLQAADHFVRVGIWDVQQGRRLVQLRVSAAGRFLTMGRRGAGTGRIARAQQRQANSCAAASEVRERLANGGRSGAVESVEVVEGAPREEEARAESPGDSAVP